MHVRIGRTLDGTPATVDSITCSALVLLGDPGMGKTTLARYLVRWWLARTDARVRVTANRVSEWADLTACRRLVVTRTKEADASPPQDPDLGLWVVDGLRDLDEMGEAALDLDRSDRRPGTTVVTAQTAWGSDPHANGVQQWGMVVRPRPHPAGNPGLSVPDSTQSRLDWGVGTRALLPDCRGASDFPVHRWRTIDNASPPIGA